MTNSSETGPPNQPYTLTYFEVGVVRSDFRKVTHEYLYRSEIHLQCDEVKRNGSSSSTLRLDLPELGVARIDFSYVTDEYLYRREIHLQCDELQRNGSSNTTSFT